MTVNHDIRRGLNNWLGRQLQGYMPYLNRYNEIRAISKNVWINGLKDGKSIVTVNVLNLAQIYLSVRQISPLELPVVSTCFQHLTFKTFTHIYAGNQFLSNWLNFRDTDPMYLFLAKCVSLRQNLCGIAIVSKMKMPTWN